MLKILHTDPKSPAHDPPIIPSNSRKALRKKRKKRKTPVTFEYLYTSDSYSLLETAAAVAAYS
jgi:hypothetical protein